jgi:hypothetical protein
VLNINRIFNGQFIAENSQERGELSWAASYLTELEDVFEQKCAQSIENGTRMPRALACRMGLGGHVQRAAPGMSLWPPANTLEVDHMPLVGTCCVAKCCKHSSFNFQNCVS